MQGFKYLSRKIVEELSELINEEIVIIDHNGFIIESTDQNRINNYHEGACIAMQKKKTMYMTKELSEQLNGVREGLVMPIMIHGEPDGVIGVTGSTEKIAQYGKLIKKIVELFLVEFSNREKYEQQMRTLEFFLLDILQNQYREDDIVKRAFEIEIDITQYNRIVLLQSNQSFEKKEMAIIELFQRIHPQVIVSRWSFNQLLLLLPNVEKKYLKAELYNLIQDVQKTLSIQLYGGIGGYCTVTTFDRSLRQAQLALEMNTEAHSILFEEELDIELLQHNLSIPTKEEYVRRILGPILEDTILLVNLIARIQSDQSLEIVAKQLHVHTNTLKYRIKKIERLLGLQLQNSADRTKIYIAVVLYLELHKKNVI